MRRCRDCQYCKAYRGRYAERYSYMCEHPEYNRVLEYFQKHRLNSMPKFLGFSKSADDPELSRKTSPPWCPFKLEEATP